MVAIEPRRNKHHFLARHLLGHFTAPDGLVHVYDRRQGWSHRRDIPERLAVENHLYAPQTRMTGSRDPKDDTVERWLADEIDGPAAAPLADIVDGAPLTALSAEARHAIADFVALLDLRTPAVRDLLTPAFNTAVTYEANSEATAQTRRALHPRRDTARTPRYRSRGGRRLGKTGLVGLPPEHEADRADQREGAPLGYHRCWAWVRVHYK